MAFKKPLAIKWIHKLIKIIAIKIHYIYLFGNKHTYSAIV